MDPTLYPSVELLRETHDLFANTSSALNPLASKQFSSQAQAVGRVLTPRTMSPTRVLDSTAQSTPVGATNGSGAARMQTQQQVPPGGAACGGGGSRMHKQMSANLLRRHPHLFNQKNISIATDRCIVCVCVCLHICSYVTCLQSMYVLYYIRTIIYCTTVYYILIRTAQ